MAEEKEQHPDTWDKTHELYKQLEAEKLSNIDPCSWKGYWTGVKTTWWAYVGGVGRGFWACVEMVASPIQTVKGLFNAAVHWDQTIQILWAQIKEASKTSEGIAGGIGNMMGGSLFFGVFGKLFSIARAGLVSKLGRVSNKLDDAAQLGKMVKSAETLVDDGIQTVEKAAEKVTKTTKRTQQTAKAAEEVIPKREILKSPDELFGIEKASDDLMEAIGKRRDLRTGQDIEKILDMQKAEASMFEGTDIILHRSSPSKAAMLEEVLHGTQSKAGIVERLGKQGAEVHVKDFMLRHSKLLKLIPEDVKILEKLLEMEIKIQERMM